MASLTANWQASELAITSVQGSIQRMSAEPWQVAARWKTAAEITLPTFIGV